MKRVGDLDKLNREVLKDNVKIRITILTILAALTIGVFVYSVIKTDVIGFILDVILLGIFVFYLTCNIIIMPIENRRYTVREIARIQSFPDEYIFGSIPLQARYKVIGNAVPPVLAWVIAKALIKQLNDYGLHK